MKIALFHNAYRTRGGEDTMVELELEALRSAGHEVSALITGNASLGKAALLRAAWDAPWSPLGYEQCARHLLATGAEVGHVHNWFPRLSPAVYAAHRDLGVPVVQTLHNYRLGCAAGTFLREGRACHDCGGGARGAAIRHGCYRGSRLQSLVWRQTMDENWQGGVFQGQVDAYLAPSQTVAKRHIELGLPAERVHVVPNACLDPHPEGGLTRPSPAGGALFVGRLSAEKGVDVLLEAWRGARGRLELIGEGPERAALERLAEASPGARLRGALPYAETLAAIQAAGVVVLPHRWEEPFGMVVIEAMACGRPVIASELGGPAELIRSGVDGLLVPPGDPGALREALEGLLADPARLAAMGAAARARYEERYRPEAHQARLLRVFRSLRRLPRAQAA